MITRAEIDLLAEGAITISGFATSKLREILDTEFSSGKPLEEIRDALIEQIGILAGIYAGASGEQAAQWYQLLRDQETVLSVFLAEVPEQLVPEGKVDRSVRWAMGPAFDGDIGSSRSRLGYALEDIVKQAGRDTISHNVGRDPARPAWARVPKGSETCPFCDMLAARGFVYGSASAAGKSQKFHAHCDCAIVPKWKESSVRIEGYDPDALSAAYSEAEEAARAEKGGSVEIADIMREMKKQNPARYGANEK